MENNEKDIHVRVLCKKLILITNKEEEEEEESIQWLIGSPFFPQFTILSTFKCLHFQSSNNPNYSKESNNVQSLLLRGFNVIGALLVGNQNKNWEENARRAVESARKLRKLLRRDDDDHVIGASADLTSGEIRYFDSTRMDPISSVVYEDSSPENYIWERGCLLRCGLDVKIPICFPVHNPADSEHVFSSVVDDTIVKLRDPNVVFMIEGAQEANGTVIVRGAKLNFPKDVSSYAILCENTYEDRGNSLFCSAFCSKNKPSRESADPIQVSIFFNKSGNPPNCSAPTAEYIPASEPAKHVVSSFKIEVLCYAAKDLPVAYAVSRLIVPGIVDQLISIKKDIMANLLTQHPKPSPFHFFPPGIMHPVTIIYELSYGETEMKQVEVRRSLHLRLGLPLDRPLLLVANALNFSTHKGVSGNSLMRNASNLLKDVHSEVPSSGVSGGLVSRVDGSYEYYHYLQDGFDDSGWGCAYRSLQTLISWFRLQHYSSVEVPSHRKIQETLVEIGDKDPSFIGSRDWIGAIELSFVLDKLLGVSCKIMNVRSGAELPEKCRELALHFETQGTPVMIGGGVLAYTLLGVDYNEASGDCAFLILDPHYTGNDELKKIITGGWCGWKKAVDSKGRNFFLHDKFYNLLLPQRPNMV